MSDLDKTRITPYERQRYTNLGFKVELIDGKVVKRPLTEGEEKKEEHWANHVLSSFLPKEKP